MKRVLAIIITLCMVMSLSGVGVFADEGTETWQKHPILLLADGAAVNVDEKFFLSGCEQ